jgi:hypothetical protein
MTITEDDVRRVARAIGPVIHLPLNDVARVAIIAMRAADPSTAEKLEELRELRDLRNIILASTGDVTVKHIRDLFGWKSLAEIVGSEQG